MSLMKSLVRVAAGVALAKGLGSAMRQHQGQQPGQAPRQGGGLLNDILGNNTTGQGAGLGDLLGRLGGSLGGGGMDSGTGTGTGTGMGGGLSGGRGRGGLGGLLDGLGGGGGSSGGGLRDILAGALGGSMAGGLAQKDSQPANDASFGQVLDDAVEHGGEPTIAPTPEQNALAGLMLRAMIQAAKADGRIDEGERARLTQHIGEDLDADEQQFIRTQMAAPVDAAALAADVPRGLEAQVYLMSLLAIELEDEAEKTYLRELASHLRLDAARVDALHRQVGAPTLN
ncbi:DUF533 domain-containing protein [Paracoccus tibetensis]|uniref:Uncharacterized membrane protein YebE, DUF533 family n=1 Tax=Paracoccus tibetensis TaxID=336292 RepID=A0A1G5J7Z8_9RHOB|nr:DUF533 domain-containing protein [Paracoccus tibetensis]SCY84493.1 Uncharacterized membrane protein YebE, DUF533 family [Paracoccus tibetensis]